MTIANRGDKEHVVNMLVQSFKDNLSVNYIVLQDKYKLKRILGLMDYSFELCFLYGNVWLSDDRRACALTLFSQQKKSTLYTIWLDIKLIYQTIGFSGISKALKRESLIKKLQPKVAMVYLWFIGVDPLYQQQGAGTSLLLEIIESANREKLPVFLETSTHRNIPWYERMGFSIYNKLDLGYELFFFKRDPENI
ncbi:GNAT family N-acetyltransferase [Mucilaginibacter sp. E4BP6]|uniref:GNAT family N-acetyltransferase n=1 Tax=Mucilaginibacter sp. E4BP6 TaxID=2723089 RepID=UPI0015CC9C05|nr:GNAT family N-acetyltransferase [Mucilaginibacter sp. E4BP6]NYE64920.1 ribosomal protein S18 acetylase RimI-like enzyme [Mucilaginibacter sp. E4BP6]